MKQQPLLAAVLGVLVAAHATVANAALPGYCGAAHEIPPPPEGYKLLQAHAFIRHGDRTRSNPGACWPHDHAVYNCSLTQIESNQVGRDSPRVTTPTNLAYRLQYQAGHETLPGNCGLGQLTSKGYQQQIANGQSLAKAYIANAGLLPSTLTPSNLSLLRLRSDDSRRTIMSGQALISGMFPTSSVDPDGDSPLIATWTIRDQEYDDIQPNPYACPNLENALDAAMNSGEMKAFLERAEPMLKEISEALGQEYDQADFGILFDCMYVHICHDLAIPPALTPTIAEQITNITTEFTAIRATYNKSTYAKIGSAKMLEEVYDAMVDIQSGQAAPRFLLFSGHDSGPIFPLLAAYEVFDNQWPPYAALITLELYSSSSGGNAVRMVYNGKVLTPAGCSSEMCPWEEFSTITKDIISYGAQCQEAGPTSFVDQLKRSRSLSPLG